MTIENKSVSVKISGSLSSAHGLVTPIAGLSQTFTNSLDCATSYISLQSAVSVGGVNIIDLVGSRTDDLKNASLFSKVNLCFLKNNSSLATGSKMVLGGHAQNIGFVSTLRPHHP